MELDSSQQTDHKKLYTCALRCRQVSVLALYFLMKLDRIVRGILDDTYSVSIVYNHYSSMNSETGVTTV